MVWRHLQDYGEGWAEVVGGATRSVSCDGPLGQRNWPGRHEVAALVSTHMQCCCSFHCCHWYYYYCYFALLLAPIMATLIIADSRGAGLQQLLQPQNIPGGTQVLVHRGAGFELSVTKSLKHISTNKPDLVVLLTGICDLTWRNKTTRLTGLRHPTVEENVNHVIQAAKAAHDLLRSEGSFKITFATITGLDLADYHLARRKHMTMDQYRDYCRDDKIEHVDQCVLNRSILEINRRLTALNKDNSIPTVWVGGIVHAYFKNTHHHQYIKLNDGCHPSDKTKIAWAGQLRKSIQRINHVTTN